LKLEFAVYQCLLLSALGIVQNDFSQAKTQSGMAIKILGDYQMNASLFEKSFIQQLLIQAE
jgi:hypothetical protein